MSIISSLQKILSSEKGTIFETKDGSSIHITPKHAYSLVSVHDTLSLDNQQKMRDLLEESEDGFVKMLSFCNKQFIKEE